jgi:hypothetical protein
MAPAFTEVLLFHIELFAHFFQMFGEIKIIISSQLNAYVSADLIALPHLVSYVYL